jgi:hypothetical protein
MIPWPSGACGRVSFKTKRRQIELIDKQIDDAIQSSNHSGKSAV